MPRLGIILTILLISVLAEASFAPGWPIRIFVEDSSDAASQISGIERESSIVNRQSLIAQDPPKAEIPWWDRATIYPARTISFYYNIKSDLPLEEVRELARHLDLTFNEYRRILGELRQNLPASFDVMIFAKREDYETTLRFHYQIDATGSGGMFFSRPQGSALGFWIENLPKRRIQHVAQHEGFHQVAAALFGGNLSPWVNEGLAELFGEGVMVGSKLVIGLSNPRIIQNVKDAIENNDYISFRRMLLMDGATWNMAVQQGSAKLQYEQAWSMVHFLAYGENGRYSVAFSNYLRNLNAGVHPYDAFVRAFGSDDVEAFEKRWIEYAQSAKPSSFLTAMERAEFLAAGLRDLAARGMYPTTLEELRDKLREIDFTYTVEQHGIATDFDADDDALYVIPQDESVSEDEEGPKFILEKTPTRGMSQKEKRLNLEKPVPYTLRTEGLRPNNLRTVWIRDLETNEFTFEIVAVR